MFTRPRTKHEGEKSEDSKCYRPLSFPSWYAQVSWSLAVAVAVQADTRATSLAQVMVMEGVPWEALPHTKRLLFAE